MSRSADQSGPSDAGPSSLKQPGYLLKQELNSKLSEIEAELKSVEDKIHGLQAVRETLIHEKGEILKQLDTQGQRASIVNGSSASHSSGGKKGGKMDYTMSSFEWTGELKRRMREVFGIQSFRLCQEGCVWGSSPCQSTQLTK